MHLHRQPNGKWRVQVRRKVDGEFVQKSKTFEFKSEAEAWGHEMELQLVNSTMTLDSAFEMYFEEVMETLKDKAETPNARKTLKARMCTLRAVQKAVEPTQSRLSVPLN